jgi:uncharacterized protein (TIGR00106 family)
MPAVSMASASGPGRAAAERGEDRGLRAGRTLAQSTGRQQGREPLPTRHARAGPPGPSWSPRALGSVLRRCIAGEEEIPPEGFFGGRALGRGCEPHCDPHPFPIDSPIGSPANRDAPIHIPGTTETKRMYATAEVQVIPLGVGVSVRKEVTRAHQVLVDSGLKVEPHAFGTNVEGSLDEILAAVKRVHDVLHAEGVSRISTTVKIGTRTDRKPTLEGKRL